MAESTTHELRTERIEPTATHPLRASVLRPGRPADEVVFAGDDDVETAHFGALLDDEVVSIGSIYREDRGADLVARDEDPHRGASWRLRGMATDPSARRRGAGAAVLRAC